MILRDKNVEGCAENDHFWEWNSQCTDCISSLLFVWNALIALLVLIPIDTRNWTWETEKWTLIEGREHVGKRELALMSLNHSSIKLNYSFLLHIVSIIDDSRYGRRFISRNSSSHPLPLFGIWEGGVLYNFLPWRLTDHMYISNWGERGLSKRPLHRLNVYYTGSSYSEEILSEFRIRKQEGCQSTNWCQPLLREWNMNDWSCEEMVYGEE